jgi:hypothetical protein
MAKLNELKDWKERLRVADRKFASIESQINRAWEYYKGNQWQNAVIGGIDPYNEKPFENMVFANIRAIVPRLNFRNPKIFVTPKKKPYRDQKGYFDTLRASAFVELLLTYYYRELNIKREAKKCLIDALLGPIGIMQLGYTVETEKVKGDELLEVNELIKSDSPFCVRRSIKDFRSDPEGQDHLLNDARWVAFRWVKSLDDVKKDDRYSNISTLKPNYNVKTDYNSLKADTNRVEPDIHAEMWGRVEGWDIWDKKEGRLMTIVKEHEKWLRNESKWPLDLEGFPCEILYMNENATDFYPIPDTWQYLSMQDELNRVASMQLSHIRRISQRRYIQRDNALTSEEQLKLTYGGDGTIVTTSMNPNDSIVPIQDAAISQDIYMVRQLLKKSIREMAGVSDTEALASTKFEQATEPALIEQSAKTIRGDQQQSFEDFIKRIVVKLSHIIQQTQREIALPLSDNQMRDNELQRFVQSKLEKIVTPEGTAILLPWLTMTKEEIQGDYEFDMEVGSTMPINEEIRKRDAVSLYQLMAENPYINGREGTKEVLEAFNKPDPEKYLKPEEEVAANAQQSAEQEVQMEIAKNAPKQQTDLAKTQMKVAASREATFVKAMGDAAKNDTQLKTAGMSLIASKLKGNGAKKNESGV